MLDQILPKKYPNVSGDISDFLVGSFSNSMFVTNTDPGEIMNIVHKLKSNSSKGNDDIAPSIIKDIISEIALPLTHIFNKAVQNGQFPDKLKIARIVPIYKCDNKKLINNYRAISVLPYFSKILERLITNV